MRITSASNQKGGVGKTTTTINVGAALAAKGRTVGLVDWDPQGHLTTAVGLSDDELQSPATLAGLVLGQWDGEPHALLRPVEENLFIIPTNEDMFTLEPQLYGKTGRERLLSRALEPLAKPATTTGTAVDGLSFDHIIIDCPPQLGALTDTALMAAHTRPPSSNIQGQILIPVQSEYSTHKALFLLLRQIAELEHVLGIEIDIAGLVINGYDKRRGGLVTDTHKQLSAMHESNDIKVLATIPDLKEMRESWGEHESVISYAPKSRSAKLYRELAKILDEGGTHG